MGFDRVMELAGAPKRDVSKNGTSLGFLENRAGALDELAPVNLSSELEGNQMANTEEMGFLMKTLDYLQRGQYAVVGAYEAFEKGEDVSEGAWKGFKGETKGSWIDVMERVIPGRHPWVEIPMGFAMDVIADPINLVPMAWFGKAGRLLKLPEMLKAADDLTRTTKVMKTVGRKLGETRVAESIGAKLIPGWSLRKVPGAYEKYRDLQLQLNNIRRLTMREMRQRWDDFREVAKALGQDPQKAAAELIRLREAGLGAEVLPEFKPFYDDIVEGLDKLAQDEVKHGLLDPKKVLDDYFPHIYEEGKVVEEGGELVTKEHKGFFTKLKFRNKPFFTKAREFKTLEQAKKTIVDWRKSGAIDEIAPIDNWFRGYAIRKFVGESAVAWKQFVEGSLDEFGVKLSDLYKQELQGERVKALLEATGTGLSDLDDIEKAFSLMIPKGFSFVTATTNLRAPKMKGMFFDQLKKALQKGEEGALDNIAEQLSLHAEGVLDVEDSVFNIFKKMGGRGVIELKPDEVATLVKGGAGDAVYLLPNEYAKEIKQTFRIFATDEGTKGFLRSMDSAVHMWKSMATSMRWPFHMRNAISNTWLMYLGDVAAPKIPKRLGEALSVQLKTGAKIQGFEPEELLRLADRYGVRAYGWMGADVPTLLQKELHIAEKRSAFARKVGIGDQPWNPFQAVSRLGRKAGTGIEDNARLGVFIDQLKKMGITKGSETPEAIAKAAQHVKKYMFDYTELTDFERRVMKRVFPFYTWLRKNIPLQLESVATKPWKYARLGDLSTATEHGMQLWPSEAASPTEKQLFKRHWMREDNFRRTPWTTSGGWPIYAKLDLPTEDLDKMWRLNTWISGLTPIFTLTQIGMNVRTWPKVGKLAEPGQKSRAPFYVSWMPQWLHKYAGVEPIVERRTGKLVLGMDPQWKYALSTAFPFLNDWERAYPQAGSLVAESDQGVYSALSYATGMKFKPFDMTEAAMGQGFRAKEAARAVRAAARKRPKLTAEQAREIFRKVMEP